MRIIRENGDRPQLLYSFQSIIQILLLAGFCRCCWLPKEMTQHSDNPFADLSSSSGNSSSFSATFPHVLSFFARSPRAFFFLSCFLYLLGRPSFFFCFDIAHFEFFIEILVMPVANVTSSPGRRLSSSANERMVIPRG